ncbi:MAG: GNAT family N-acetyltransferase [Clostridia bacterium]|nr:GNAT family N-acetyltransferase [Clostridia bacterium]
MPFLKRSLFRRQPAFTDGVIDLYPLMTCDDPEINIDVNYVFKITRHGSFKEIGQISLRLGEGPGIYFFGHIGYHIDPPYRGHGYALCACRLIKPLCQRLHQRSVVITTDTDNLPSRKICEHLGCVLESVVPVPVRMQNRFQLSSAKCRYIWVIQPGDEKA